MPMLTDRLRPLPRMQQGLLLNLHKLRASPIDQILKSLAISTIPKAIT
jgi:hypothetical protein